MQRRFVAVVLCSVLLLGFSSLATATDFSGVVYFNSNAVGTTTPFSEIFSGATATFSSAPGAFAVHAQDAFFATGNYLVDNDDAQNALTIGFDVPLNHILMSFGFPVGGCSNSITLAAYTGTDVKGSQTEFADFCPIGQPWALGMISFGLAGPHDYFDRVVLTADARDFAVDSIQVQGWYEPPTVPEPASVVLLAFGAVGLLGTARKTWLA